MPELDIATLTRTLNELFSGLSPVESPSEPAPSLVDAAARPVAAQPLRIGSGIPSVPTEVAGLTHLAPTSVLPSATPAASPALPAFSPASVGAPSFYFLEHARAPVAPAPLALGFADARAAHAAPFDVARIKADFPILGERVKGRALVWLDNAATTQKPTAVIERLKYFYEHENSNIHRAAHELAARATDAYEDAREKTRAFLNASSTNEIVFLRGATEAINLVAQTFGRARIGAGDEIVVSHLEHHANIVPWQQLASEVGAKLRVIPVDDDGQLILSELDRLLGPRTKLVSVTHVSNALGTVTPVKQIIERAHAVGARVLIDGAQSVSHMPVDVQALDADFYVFSGHKVFAPTGIGVLFGKASLLDELPPWQGGGNMIEDVTFEHTRYQKGPARFEAGTGNIADAVGLGAALDYVGRLGLPLIEAYEHQLLAYGTSVLKSIAGVRLLGTAPDKAGVLSFLLDGFRTDEVSKALNEEGIAVRGGHHCAQPILRRFGVESTVRPSLALYNDCADLDRLGEALLRIKSRRAPSVSVPTSINAWGL